VNVLSKFNQKHGLLDEISHLSRLHCNYNSSNSWVKCLDIACGCCLCCCCYCWGVIGVRWPKEK